MNLRNKKPEIVLLVSFLIAVALFFILFFSQQIKVDKIPPTNLSSESGQQNSALNAWSAETSQANGLPILEDKNIYERNSNLYDVYISVFPTKDNEGNMLDFSSFSKHESRNHDYNPQLNCNIQILKEGQNFDRNQPLNQKNATIRVRGNSSRGDQYKSYKIKLDKEAQPFFGQTVLNINKHSEDPGKIATKLSMDLIAEMDDMVSFRTYFMRVWIRDCSLPKNEQRFRYYGLFTEIEQPNKTYLERRGLPSNAVMYKARNFSFSMQDELKDVDDPGYSQQEFETCLGIREGKNHKKLLDMVAAVNDLSRPFEEIFPIYFNEENYLTWLAFNLLLENDDIINHNFIIYSPENSMTWYFIPWDVDGAMNFGKAKGSLMYLPPSLRGAQKLNQSIVHRRYLQMDGSIEKLKNKMQELLNTVLTKENIDSLTGSYMPVLEKTLPLNPDVTLLGMPLNELPQYIESIHGEMEENYNAFCYAMDFPTPMYVAKPTRQGPDDQVFFSWEPSYSYQGLPVTYNVKLYADYNMKKLLWEQSNIPVPYCIKPDGLENGTYYLMVTAVDSQGREQLSMERFETMLTDLRGYNVNGLLEFTLE